MPGAATTAVVDSRRGTQHAEGPATILAIGTANPTNIVPQDEFTDYYFGVTKSEHLTELKDKMKRICLKSGIEKRYIHLDEEIICAHPNIIDKQQPSLETRVEIAATEVPKLAESAARKAIAEWGRPATDITHLIFSTYSALSELTLVCFSTPNESKIVGHGLFGDGAGAIIVGAGSLADGERPLFKMVAASQTTIPGTGHALGMQATDSGIDFHLSIQVPTLIKDNIQQTLLDTFRSVGNNNPNWNDLFWAVHPGGRAILDNIEGKLQLQPWKLAASRQVLHDYGNMSGATIAFVLDELRRRREKEEHELQQHEWGVMLAFGPGITIEAIVMRNPQLSGLKEN
ncbi:hypothetical protein OsJ_30836 [Oryza sativa Japonica Group]|uniref:Chalcone synthase n=2 Tax=Oryza sativa subsp. japonica TaxID=39947 RepID=Q7G524_ORYSJ|nr:putative chalcone synthase [Oryza sativa Japonica Group]AAN04192.1 Putative chalcone synthase [Oryza sativa Japonica Group]AAP52312.1 Chalcone and stilbene synthases, N-terminal domain containing protein [Oryza sativa Japonica Group]EAZ15422.1 hypothetical protein OsJ_30836 [Oryza sativa Japonica Group]